MKARFCLTASNTILPTIKSRCVCYMMQPYTNEQIKGLLCDSELALVQNSVGVIGEWVDSPGQLQLLVGWGNGDILLNLIEQMSNIKSELNQPLAVVMNKANNLGKYMKEQGVDFYTFFLLAKGLYSEFESYSILTQNLYDLDRYIMCYFYSEMWKEVACK